MFLALPLMLVAWVGCSKDNAEEKKTDSLKVSEEESKADKKALETVNKELDKLKEEKAELEKQNKEASKGKDKKEESIVKKEESTTNNDKSNKVEEPNKEVVKEAVIGGGRTLAEERAYIDKKLNNESRHYSPLEQYQEEVEETSKELVTAVKSSKSLLEKDKTMQTNKSELKGQLSVVSGRMDRLASIEPPKDYDYFKVQLRDDAKIIKQVVDQAFIAFNENDTEKPKQT